MRAAALAMAFLDRDVRVVAVTVPLLDQMNATVLGGEHGSPRKRDQRLAIPLGEGGSRPAAVAAEVAAVVHTRAARHSHREPAAEVIRGHRQSGSGAPFGIAPVAAPESTGRETARIDGEKHQHALSLFFYSLPRRFLSRGLQAEAPEVQAQLLDPAIHAGVGQTADAAGHARRLVRETGAQPSHFGGEARDRP